MDDKKMELNEENLEQVSGGAYADIYDRWERVSDLADEIGDGQPNQQQLEELRKLKSCFSEAIADKGKMTKTLKLALQIFKKYGI